MQSQTADSATPSPWFFPFALALSAVLLSMALTFSNGFLAGEPSDAITLLLLTLSLGACFCAIVFHDTKLPVPTLFPRIGESGATPAEIVLLLGCAAQFVILGVRYGARMPLLLVPLLSACAFSIFWIFSFFIVNRRMTIRSVTLGLCALGSLLVCAFLVIAATPNDIADVMIFQCDSSRALAAGINPYAMTFPDIYSARDSSLYYGEGVSVNGVLQFGFPYLPFSLLWVAPAQLLLGDFRYGHLAAVALAAVFIVTLRPSRTTAAAAILLAFSAPTFYVLQNGWTEPVVAMLFCFNIWLLMRRTQNETNATGAAAISLGLFLATKQYLVFALPLLFLLPLESARTRSGARWKMLGVALIVAALTVLPFALWNFRAFWWSVFELQFHQPFRDSALTYLAAFKAISSVQLSSAICFLLAGGSVWLCWKRAPRTVAGFAASVALVHFVFFAFNKQAFANYYFFVFAALCCATAAAHSERNALPETSPL